MSVLVGAIPCSFTPLAAPFYRDIDERTLEMLINEYGKGVLTFLFDNSEEERVQPPLRYAISRFSNPALVQRLIELGADVDEPDPEFGETALHVIAQRGRFPSDLRVLELLLANTQNVNIRDRGNFTPLHHAANNVAGVLAFEILRLLLEKGADPEAVTLTGETVLDIVVKNGRVLSSELTEIWVQKIGDLIGKYRTPDAQGPSLDVIRAETKALVAEIKSKPFDFTQQKIRNPRLLLDKPYPQLRENSLSLVHARAELLHKVQVDLSKHFYRWRISQHPEFSNFFDQEVFDYLLKLYREDDTVLKMLNAKNNSG